MPLLHAHLLYVGEDFAMAWVPAIDMLFHEDGVRRRVGVWRGTLYVDSGERCPPCPPFQRWQFRTAAEQFGIVLDGDHGYCCI